MWRECSRWRLWAGCCALLVITASPARGDLVITEFMASNDGFLEDDDGNSPDWIEVYNTASGPINLGGWSLTDDSDRLRMWTFPDRELRAGEYLIVFASGKDRRSPDRELHTNFQLSSGGDFLALVRPDLTIAAQFRPRFPPQESHASFGLEAETVTQTMAGAGTVVRYLVPPDATLDLTWTELEFDDTSWAEAELPIGFDVNPDPVLTSLFTTDISEAMFRRNASVYVRVVFEIADLSEFQSLLLQIRYADGFLVYLNGEEIARRNAPVTVTRRSAAVENRAVSDVEHAETINLTDGALQPGTNVVAFQALNYRPSSLEFLLAPEIEGTSVLNAVGPIAFFAEPTPGWTNGEGFPGIAPTLRFSPPSGAIAVNTFVELTTDAANTEIRYTTDRSLVTESSLLYTEPILLERHSEIRARVFVPGLIPSAPNSAHYVVTDEELAAFSSNVPIVIIQTSKNVVDSIFTEGNLFVIDAVGGRSVVSGPVDFAGFAGFKTRGSSSGGRTKKSMRLEIRNQESEDKDVSILDLPAGSDWILYGAFNFDQAHLRNPFMYELSNQVGRYAVRTRFCEVFLVENSSVAHMENYFGVYSFMESVKRGENRVNIQALTSGQSSAPEISGGYLVKIDRSGPGDKAFPVAQQTVLTVDPAGQEITDEQFDWFLNYMNAMVASLDAPDARDPGVALEDKSYAAYLDPESWIDHHLLNVFSKNADALRLSTYLYKNRQSRVEYGPIWDFDRSIGSTDGRDRDPFGWDGGTNYFGYPWWRKLFDDPVFSRRYGERWAELRGGPLSTQNFRGIVDDMANEIAEAASRDANRWVQVAGEAGWRRAVEHMKDWLTTRARWIDSQLLPIPEFDLDSGVVAEATEVSLFSTTGDIYYTLDQSDPRTDDDRIDPTAILYTKPVVITENTRIRARTVVSEGAFSALADGYYITSILPLVVTEVMYAPRPDPAGVLRPSDFEYIELQNISDAPIELAGVSLGPEPEFQFDGQDHAGNDLSQLLPGGRVVVVRNIKAFSSRYDIAEIKVAGEFTTPFATYSDIGDQIVLFGAVGEHLLDFSYDDEWHPSTRVGGRSLVIVDPNARREDWNTANNWRASYLVDGSPGREDILPSDLQRPGDVNQDGLFNFPDVRALLAHLFDGAASRPCGSGAASDRVLDVNGDSAINVTDVVYALRYLFQSGPPPTLGSECISIAECSSICVP